MNVNAIKHPPICVGEIYIICVLRGFSVHFSCMHFLIGTLSKAAVCVTV